MLYINIVKASKHSHYEHNIQIFIGLKNAQNSFD